MQRRSQNWTFLAWYLPFHVLVTAFTWRDIGGRSQAQIRGSKWLWRVLSAANTGGSVAYLVCGRRRN